MDGHGTHEPDSHGSHSSKRARTRQTVAERRVGYSNEHRRGTKPPPARTDEIGHARSTPLTPKRPSNDQDPQDEAALLLRHVLSSLSRFTSPQVVRISVRGIKASAPNTRMSSPSPVINFTGTRQASSKKNSTNCQSLSEAFVLNSLRAGHLCSPTERGQRDRRHQAHPRSP